MSDPGSATGERPRSLAPRDAATPAPSPGARIASAWTDRFGRFSIRALQVLVVAALGLAVLQVIGVLRLVIVPVVLALLLSAAFAPLVALLHRRARFPQPAAAAAAMLLALLVLGGVVTLVVLQVQAQWSTLAKSASDGIEQVQGFLTGPPLNLDSGAFTKLRESLTKFVTSGSFGSGALAGVAGFVDFITALLVLIVTLFFFLKDGATIWEFLLKPLGPRRTRRARRIGAAGLGSLGGYVRGTALVALVDAVLIGGGLFVLQVPLALPLAVIVFLTAFIPIVGATIAGAIAALVTLVTNGFVPAVIVVVIVVVVNQLEGNLLQPVIMGRTVRLHPLVILLALIVGSILAGVTGAIVAVPITSVIWDAMKLWDADDVPEAAQHASG
jgi:predicted PurR-regulated permease PerM